LSCLKRSLITKCAEAIHYKVKGFSASKSLNTPHDHIFENSPAKG
jgi:hypothetical protein